MDVVLVSVDEAYGQGLTQEFKSRLDSSANFAGDVPNRNYVDIRYDPQDPDSVQMAADALGDSGADLVVVVGFEESADILKITRDNDALRTTPFFVTDGVRTDRLRTIYAEGQKPEFLFGTSAAGRTGATYDRFAHTYLDEYGGDAAALWTAGDPDGPDVFRRLKALPGFGEQKAKIFLALLGKQYGVTPKGWRAAAGDYGKAGTHMSVADVTDAGSLTKVRTYKKEAKAAAKAARLE